MQFPMLACGIKYVTLLIVTSNLNRFPGECLQNINMYQNVRYCALMARHILLYFLLLYLTMKQTIVTLVTCGLNWCKIILNM